MQELRRHPLLTAQQEQELGHRVAAGDQEALRTLVTANLRLVVAVAREYGGRGVPMMDLIQEGNIGLIAAARRFDPELDFRFSTYATKWIRQGITRSLMDHAGLIRVPVHTAHKIRRLMTLRGEFVRDRGREPELEELAALAGLTEAKTEKLLRLMPQVCSLDAPVGEEDGTLGQLLPDRSSHSPMESLVQAQLLELLGSLMEKLEPRQQTILRLHFGMDDGVCRSLEEIAGRLGISKERTRQVEKQAFERLKKMGAHMGLEDFLED